MAEWYDCSMSQLQHLEVNLSRFSPGAHTREGVLSQAAPTVMGLLPPPEKGGPAQPATPSPDLGGLASLAPWSPEVSKKPSIQSLLLTCTTSDYRFETPARDFFFLYFCLGFFFSFF